MKKILCIGEALIDMICTDKGVPLSKGEHFLKKAGGAPANVAGAIAALGGQVELAAKVGADPFGQHIEDTLKDMKVGTRLLFRDKLSFTTLAFVSLMENGERDFYFNRGADGQFSLEDLKAIHTDAYGIIHFGSATAFLPGPLQKSYVQLLATTKGAENFISFDPNYRELLYGNNKRSFSEQSWNFLTQCHFFKVSDEEAFLLTGAESIEEAAGIFLQKTDAVFAITLGSKGTLLGYKGETCLIESISVNPIDTTGAGDAFVGALLYQLQQMGTVAFNELKSEDWIKLIFNANKAGARTCQYVGAMEAFRHLSSQIFE